MITVIFIVLHANNEVDASGPGRVNRALEGVAYSVCLGEQCFMLARVQPTQELVRLGY